MPAKLKRMEAHIRASGRKKGLKGDRLDAYVYGSKSVKKARRKYKRQGIK